MLTVKSLNHISICVVKADTLTLKTKSGIIWCF